MTRSVSSTRSGGRLHVAFAGGGTGGHLYPMLTLAGDLRRRVGTRFTFFTTDRAIDERIIRATFGDDESIRIVSQPVRPLPARVGAILPFWRSWRSAIRLCRASINDDKPDLIVGSGGFGSAPPIVVGRRREIPMALLNPDAVPGKANRFLARRVDVVYVQWSVTQGHLASARETIVSGCPVRPAFVDADRGAGVERFNLDPDRRTLLITGASQGARSINDAIVDGAERIAVCEGWQILHLAGRDDVERVRSAYQKQNVHASVLDYTDHMPEALAAADLIVSRAGASTLAEIATANVPAILVPYPYHRDRHQYHNARVLESVGLARIVDDPVLGPENATRLIDGLVELMTTELARISMIQQDFALSNRDAAGIIVDDLLRRLADSTARTSAGPARGHSGNQLPRDGVACARVAAN